METAPRHQCLVYEGSPSRHLPVLAAAICEKLEQNYRCLYLNSPPMVAGMRSYLAAKGLDVIEQTRRGALVLTSELHHSNAGQFDTDAMLHGLEEALQQAVSDGYKGLWASGDMTWEFSPAKDFSQLLEYEWRLEELFQKHPEFGGVCQYHADTLPREVMRQGLLSHPLVFINETLTLLNPHYLESKSSLSEPQINPELETVVDSSLDRLLRLEFAI